MDTSKEYIEMCEKAKEIQKESPCRAGFADNLTLWDSGDKIVLGKYRKGSLRTDSNYNLMFSGWWKGQGQHIWLPRQDQLQNIYAEYIGADGYCALIDFGEWFKGIFELDELTSDKRIYDTPEQLWLAFVMEKLYSEFWDGKEWIKKNG